MATDVIRANELTLSDPNPCLVNVGFVASASRSLQPIVKTDPDEEKHVRQERLPFDGNSATSLSDDVDLSAKKHRRENQINPLSGRSTLGANATCLANPDKHGHLRRSKLKRLDIWLTRMSRSVDSEDRTSNDHEGRPYPASTDSAELPALTVPLIPTVRTE